MNFEEIIMSWIFNFCSDSGESEIEFVLQHFILLKTQNFPTRDIPPPLGGQEFRTNEIIYDELITS